jgi:hypothetical protein
MVNPTRWRKALYLALALAAVLAGSLLHGPLVRTRDTWSRRPAVENFPPSLVLGTQMLGSFRGMLVVGLWMRATELQEQGRYYELKQLYDWITELEPRLETVWTYAAWNEAYNISVAFPATQPEERWRWVTSGLSVLRDRGLKMNPRSYLLNRELAWMYFHKIGGTSDEAHGYYKQEFARELHVILGGPAPDWARLAAAPTTDTALLADEGVSALVGKARVAGFEPLDRDIAWLNDPSKLPKDAAPLFEAAKGTPAFEALEAFLRARALREDWRLEPKRVKALVEKYGPLDFRTPWPHALYWGAESLKVVRPTENPIHGERMIYNSLVQIFETGRLIYYPDEGLMFLMPDVRFADAANNAFIEEIKQTEAREEIGPTSAHKNWLRNAMTTLYLYGAKEKAADFFRDMQQRYPRTDYPATVVEFVLREIRNDLEEGQYEQVKAYIRFYVRLSYYWLAAGDREASDGHLAMAKALYALHQDKAPPRLQMEAWDQVLKQVLDEVLDPRRGFPKVIRDRLRPMVGLPPEAAETPAAETPAPEGPESGGSE